jgi:hypothetical protein
MEKQNEYRIIQCHFLANLVRNENNKLSEMR